MAQEKQLEKLILTDSKNIFTQRFQPIQRLDLIFMTDSRTLMHTKYNGNNPKVGTFLLIPLWQRIQIEFLTDSIRSFLHTKLPNTQTQLKQPKQQHQRGIH